VSFRQLVAAVLLPVLLAACSSGSNRANVADVSAAQTREYAPPGPPDDPWGPYIREAAQRYDLSEQWIRAVMRQESGGQQYHGGALTTSSSGAIGLMQVMPETYAALRIRYGLGPDPYYPRDNILGGTAYLRELYDRFGSPAFLAAYNAGPKRASDLLTTGRPLPAETVAYVAAIGPQIGAAGTVSTGARANSSDDLNRQALAAVTGRAVPATTAPPPRYLGSPPPAPVVVATAAAGASGGWGIQIGAFSNPALAQAAADNVRAHAHGQLDITRTVVPATTRPDGVVLYRARLIGLSADAASNVCNNLARDQVSCIIVTADRA
jgi:D-alanyl-D-alanine carboxypeptidase